MLARPITPFVYGKILETASLGPATMQINWPESAMAGAPKTGIATNLPPAEVMREDSLVVVSGWTVEQSTRTLPETEDWSMVFTVESTESSSPKQ